MFRFSNPRLKAHALRPRLRSLKRALRPTSNFHQADATFAENQRGSLQPTFPCQYAITNKIIRLHKFLICYSGFIHIPRQTRPKMKPCCAAWWLVPMCVARANWSWCSSLTDLTWLEYPPLFFWSAHRRCVHRDHTQCVQLWSCPSYGNLSSC